MESKTLYTIKSTQKSDTLPTIQKAEFKDLPEIMEIYRYARNYMKLTGNPNQWKDSSPSEEIILNDIQHENLYVILQNKEIHAVFAFISGEDPTYSRIEQGRWLQNTPYATLHRIAGDGKLHGIFSIIIEFCSEQIGHLRIDTHQDNQIMQHLICKNGFQKCGIIYVEDGSPRIAYEKIEMSN